MLADADNFTFAKLLLTCLASGSFVSDSSQLIQYLCRDLFLVSLSDKKTKDDIELPELEANLDKLENSNEIPQFSPVEYTMDPQCYVLLFNRMDRENFENITKSALRYVQNHSFKNKPIFLVGFNWSRYFFSNDSMKRHFMYQRVVKHSKDFVSHDEIMSFCEQHSNVIGGYIDAKPYRERDVDEILMKLVSLICLTYRVNILSELEANSLCLF